MCCPGTATWELAAGESGSTACHCLCFLLILLTGAVESAGPEQGEREEVAKDLSWDLPSQVGYPLRAGQGELALEAQAQPGW